MTCRGVLLLEATLSSLILSLALVSLIPALVLSIRTATRMERTRVETQLASSLIEEIRLRRWDESSPADGASVLMGSAVRGIDASESSLDKSTFDDVDDFHGWSETTVLDPIGRPVTGLEGYWRNARIEYVNASGQVSAQPTDRKQITTCGGWSTENPLCLTTLFTNH